MSWHTNLWTKRIYNVFKRSKTTIYPEDIEAFKNVINELEQTEKRYVNDNILFAKLLTIHLTQNIDYYGSIGNAIKETQKIISMPFNYHLQILSKTLNEKELYNYFESIGLKDWKNKSERDLNEKIINENRNEIYEKLKKNWSVEQVEKSLYSSANDLLKDIDNYN